MSNLGVCVLTNDLLRSSTNVYYCLDVDCSTLHAIHLPRREKRVLADTGLFLERAGRAEQSFAKRRAKHSGMDWAARSVFELDWFVCNSPFNHTDPLYNTCLSFGRPHLICIPTISLLKTAFQNTIILLIMSYTSAQLSASAPGAHSRKPSSALATSFMGNWTSDDDLDNIGRQYSFCYGTNFRKVGAQRYDAAFSELVSYQFEAPRSKKAGNVRTSSWGQDARIMDLPSEDDVLDLADASKAKLDVQSTNAVGALEDTAAGTSAAPASLAIPGSMTPISTSSSAADWLNDDRVWDGENVCPSHFFVCPPSHLPHVDDPRVCSYPCYTVH